MNDILGILIPMLMSGSDIGSIVRALGGAGQGAAGIDGLSAMMNAQMSNATKTVPLRQSQETISRAAEMLVDRLGVNPLSGLGQGLSSMFGSMYNLAPDTFGAVLGVPNGGRFFSQIAGGASGIGEAAGFGTTEMFNPYSVMASHRRAMSMGRTMYSLGTRENGGYNIDFSHGLNMDEMGMMAQRLLSSEIPYREYKRSDPFGGIDTSSPTGRTLDPENDAKEFKNNLDKLGSRFNEAASMLSKITGSVKDAIGLMDRLAGGNFLGGTAEQATEVANRAKKMATAIRVTSAIAGISPQEAYANMTRMQSGIVEGMGVNSYIGEASGFSGLMTGMAYNGTMAYNMWAATNPRATDQEKAQALLAANGRTQAYATSDGAILAAMFADNEGLFTEDERSQFEQSFIEGDPNRMVDMIRGKIGSSTFSEYMTDPAMQVAARVRAGSAVDRYDQAGMVGNLAQAEAFGAKRLLGKAMSDLDEDLGRATGGSGYSKSRDEAVKERLAEIAVEQGITKEGALSMDLSDLRKTLSGRPGIDSAKLQRIENTAVIDAAKGQIDAATMTSEEDASARERLINAISSSTAWKDDKKREFIDRIGNGEDVNDVLIDFSSVGMKSNDVKELRESVLGGKMTKGQADILKKRLARIEESQRPEYSSKERMYALERDVKRSRVESIEELGGLISGNDFNIQSDNAAMDEFARKSKELEGRDVVFTGDDENLSGTYREAAKRMVAKIFDGNVGDLSDEDQKALEESVAKNMLQGLYEFGSFDKSFVNALDSLTEDQKKKLEKGGGLKRIQQLREQAQDKNSQLRKKDLNKTAFFSASKSVIGETTEAFRSNAVKEMNDIIKGNFGGSDAKATERFLDLAKSIGHGKGADGKDLDLNDLRRSGMEDILKDAGVSSDDISGISENAMRRFSSKDGGDAKRAMVESLRERAGAKGVDKATKERLEKAADDIEKRDNVSSSMVNSMFGKIYNGGTRDNTFNAMYAAGNKDQALVTKAASQSGVDMRQVKMNANASASVSAQDDITAEANQNRITNAIQAGGASFTREAVAHTKKQIEELGKRLSKAGIKEDVLSDLASGDKSKYEAAAKTIREKALKGRTDQNYDLALIQSVSESTLGGIKGTKVLLEGERGLENARKSGGADKLEEDLVGVTKSAGRKDSDAYGILNSISELVQQFSKFADKPVDVVIKRNEAPGFRIIG